MLDGIQESGGNQVHHLECCAGILLLHRAWMDLNRPGAVQSVHSWYVSTLDTRTTH